MAERDRNDPPQREDEQPRPARQQRGGDWPGGRDFAGASYASTEIDQTRTRDEVARHGMRLDEAGEIAEGEEP